MAVLILQGRISAPNPAPNPTPTPDTQAPQVVISSPAPGLVTRSNVAVIGQATDDRSGVATLEAQVDGGAFVTVAVDAAGNFHFDTALPLDGTAEGAHTVRLRAADLAGNIAALVPVAFTLDTLNPAVGLPPLDLTVATTIGAATEFLYTGTDPVQIGVAPGTIEPVRAAVLRGQVTDRAGAPLLGVTITVLGHPEFGTTHTRADGMFDLAVNGGGMLTVIYSQSGFLPVQRQVDVPWQDYAWLPDVVMISLDTQVTTIDLNAAVPMQTAQGSLVTDADGTRQATVMFAQGTQAALVLPDGTHQAVTTLNVRATNGASGSFVTPVAIISGLSSAHSLVAVSSRTSLPMPPFALPVPSPPPLPTPPKRRRLLVPVRRHGLQPGHDLLRRLRVLALQRPSFQNPLDALRHVQPTAPQWRVQRQDPVRQQPYHQRQRLVPRQVVQHQQQPQRRQLRRQRQRFGQPLQPPLPHGAARRRRGRRRHLRQRRHHTGQLFL